MSQIRDQMSRGSLLPGGVSLDAANKFVHCVNSESYQNGWRRQVWRKFCVKSWGPVGHSKLSAVVAAFRERL